MPITRVFLGWDRPGLEAVVEHLVGRFAAGRSLDLARVILAVPGARAGRRLLEILVQRAEDRGWALSPPEIVTLGRLPELLYVPKRPFADDFVQQLAWIEALRRSDSEELRPFLPSLPAADDLAGRLALAEMLGRLHRELAADGLDFPAVANRGRQVAGFRETPRWTALAGVQRKYLDTLNELDIWDVQTARLIAIRQKEYQTESEIVLAGTVDLNRVQRQMLDQVADRAIALVLAPPALADRFDAYGCVRPEAWQEARIDLNDGQIELVDSPADQAAAAMRAIASFDGQWCGEEITIGVPDKEVVPHLEQALRQCGVAARNAAGLPIGRAGPFRLLAAVADYLEGRQFSSLAALARHPAVQHWLEGRGIRGDCLSELDDYYSQHLPHDLSDSWLGPAECCRLVRRAHKSVERLLEGLDGERRTLDQWGQPVLDLLAKVFGGKKLDPEAEPDRTVLAVCGKVREAADRHRAIPARLMPCISGAEALRLVLRQIEGETSVPPSERGAVELLGWLELPLDDAPALVLTGFNEGIVPSGVRADLFLPNQLRAELDLDDNDRRYARDAYALSVLAASRQRLQIIVGRRSGEGDPLTPSRLLFACNEETAARRVRRLFSTADHTAPRGALPGGLRPGKTSRLEVPRPRPLAEPVASMRVTEFRDYLACPYRYYLRHRLHLAVLDDGADELDAAAFGTLVHNVLRDFGLGEAAGSDDPEAISAHLSDLLDQVVAEVYGPAPLAAVRIQAAQARLRLRAFAQWQAGWVRQGWRIEYVEQAIEQEKAVLVVDGRPMHLRGRIDRVDVHEGSGRRIVFDYKTSDTPKTPEKAHRKEGAWVDLQLPLYRHLVRGLGIDGPVELAYIALPKDTTRVGPLPAEWTEGDLKAADQAAEEVVRSVRAEKFWPPASPPPPFSEDLAAICGE